MPSTECGSCTAHGRVQETLIIDLKTVISAALPAFAGHKGKDANSKSSNLLQVISRVVSIRQVILEVLSLCDPRKEDIGKRRQEHKELQQRHLAKLTESETRENR